MKFIYTNSIAYNPDTNYYYIYQYLMTTKNTLKLNKLTFEIAIFNENISHGQTKTLFN